MDDDSFVNIDRKDNLNFILIYLFYTLYMILMLYEHLSSLYTTGCGKKLRISLILCSSHFFLGLTFMGVLHFFHIKPDYNHM